MIGWFLLQHHTKAIDICPQLVFTFMTFYFFLTSEKTYLFSVFKIKKIISPAIRFGKIGGWGESGGGGGGLLKLPIAMFEIITECSSPVSF